MKRYYLLLCLSVVLGLAGCERTARGVERIDTQDSGDVVLFDTEGFSKGTQDYSWDTSKDLGVTQDGVSGVNVGYNAPWAGLSLKLNDVRPTDSSSGVAVTLKGSGQQLSLWLGEMPLKSVQVRAGSSLSTVYVPWQDLGFPKTVERISLQEFEGKDEQSIFVEKIYLYTDSEPAPDEPPPTAQTSLRNLAAERGIVIGAAIKAEPLEEQAYADIAAREFNMLSPEGSFLISEMHDPQNPYVLKDDLSQLDKQIDYALAQDAQVQGFHLVWFLEGQWAPWLTELPQTRRREFIQNRIQSVMQRYKGKVKHYSVVNEAFEKDGSLRGATTDGIENWLYEPNAAEKYKYIEYSFRAARKADPAAKLFYNDYGTEFDGPKWDAVLEMVKYFKDTGVPIDGVGFQTHLNMKWGPLPDSAQLAKHMKQLEALGVEARITEFDLGIEGGPGSEEERLKVQAQYYKDYLNVCLNATNCTAFQMWGLTDKYSWITTPEWGGTPAAKPLIYDSDYQPKPAYYALRRALVGH